MAVNYQVLSEKDLARGIDARSTEDRIAEGYAEDLINVDTNSNGFLSKRKGYQGYYGYLPIRITQIEHEGTTIKFTLDGSISTTNIGNTPIVVYGKLSGAQGTGDWTNTNNAEYYTALDTDSRKQLTSPSGTLTVEETEHGNDTSWLFAQLTDSTDANDSDNTHIIADKIQISSSDPYDVDFDYTVPSNTDTFAMITDKQAVAGTTYTRTDTIGTTTTTVTISAATHGLTNFNIITEHYYDNGSSEWEKFIPDEVRINATSGQVEVDITNSGASADFRTILTAAPVANVYTETVATSASSQNLTAISTTEPFNFVAVYTSDAGTLTRTVPDSVSFSDDNDELTVAVTNNTGSDVDYVVYYEPMTLSSSVLTVTDNASGSTNYTDTAPQLTLWGISHENIYNTSSNQEGHVSHIDSYRSDLEERVVAGLGGNLFSAQTRSEAGDAYLIPSTNVSIQNRVGSDTIVGPLFATTAGSRTRGSVYDASISSNLATVTAVSYVSATTADYTLSFTSKTGTISTSIDTGDYFTIAGMGHSVWNGTWQYVSTQSESSTEAVIRLTNTNAILADYDETGAMGTCGCFTDKITLSATTNFAADDSVASDSFSSVTPSVVSTNSTTLYINGITTELSLPTGLALYGTRTTNTLPVESTTNFVVGDMCTLTSYDRQVRVTAVSTANTTITIDESLEISDAASPDVLAVVGRWIPIEAPTTTDDLPATTYIRHLDNKDYDKQATVRSVMVSDNMYFTNNNDEVMKFDGTNLYQAGIFRWQPQLFAQLDTTTTSITTSSISGTVTAVSGNKFTVGRGEESQFAVGDTVVHSSGSATYTVQSTFDNGTTGLVFVVGSITGAGSGTLKKVNRYKYYFCLHAIDANQNIIASAATGASDFLMDLSAAGQIHMRLVGFPVWGNYDYDKLEIEVYRTAADTAAPFFRVRTASVDFNHGAGYIDIVDSTDDEDLKDLDAVTVALKGAELGTTWEQPLRAKYATTADNRLVLANVKDYPELDIVMRKTAGATSVTAANLDTKTFLFRKDSTDSATTTDMINRAKYEFVDGGAVTITPNTDITSTATSFTVADASHTLSAGDWVYLFHAAAATDNELNFAGWFQVASVNAGTDFTIDFSGHGRSTGGGATTDVDRYVAATTSTDIPVWLGTDGNYNQVGANTINEFTAMQRLANAINASMRMTDTSNSSFGTFVPWLTANAGSEYGVGRMVVRQPGVFSTSLEVVLPAAIDTASIFVGGLLKSAAAEVSASSRVFPSRVIISYANYPEIFDNPFGDPSASDSVIDVNSADGQQITGIIPFFGESAFGGSQVEGVLVVFKTNSIYLLDISTKQLTKIQSRGLGCTAPYSIASTRDGIMFANEAGVYRLNRSQSISYVGKFVERFWEDTVNRDQLSVMTGHHYGTGRQYKLSVPVGSATTNSAVLVYDHQREARDQEFGAWTRYDNHNATGWANLGNDAFFGSTSGQVFSIRRLGESSDYRDNSSAVDMTILYRPMDFGSSGVRKIIAAITSHFQLRRTSMTGTTLYTDEDLAGTFTSAGTFTMTKSGSIKGESADSSPSRRRMQYLQLKYLNSTKDEDVVLSGIDFKVSGLPLFGLPEQNE